MADRTYAAVTPQHWLQSVSYTNLRRDLLRHDSWRAVGKLGDGAFDYSGTWELRIALVVLEVNNHLPHNPGPGFMVTAQGSSNPADNACELTEGVTASLDQSAQLKNPDSRVLAVETEGVRFLSDYADAYQGTSTGDNVRFTKYFWELSSISQPWTCWQSTVSQTQLCSGLEQVVKWRGAEGVERLGAAVRGRSAWNRRGLAVSQMGDLPVALYFGDLFDNNVAAVIPKRESDFDAIAHYLMSGEYHQDVRQIDSALKVMNATLVKIPFDVDRWRRVAEGAGPLPAPWSDDPTQWLFEGRPEVSTDPLQVAVARLVGYGWPEQSELDDLNEFADVDGVVCLPSVAGEAPADGRLQRVLVRAFGEEWGQGKLRKLLEQTGSNRRNLASWLRDDFFKLHCRLFHNRPFVWHIWDGRKDGFSALVNYHRLDRRMLEKLTHTYLGQDWMERQRAEVRDEVAGAEARLAAAQTLRSKLEAILEGEPPYDIYVRWKDLHGQPLGWEPDLNDGVRLNIRPFVEAGVLRSRFNVHWKNDRGKNPDGSERRNDRHVSRAEKLEARQEVGL